MDILELGAKKEAPVVTGRSILTNAGRIVCATVWLGVLAVGSPASAGLEREFINPANGYTQVVAVTQGSVRTIYVSGQIGEGDTLEEQLRAVFESLGKQLSDAGAGFEHLVKINSYIVGYRPADLAVFRKVRKEFLGDTRMPASTLVGVGTLALRRWLVEIEAVAIVDTAAGQGR